MAKKKKQKNIRPWPLSIFPDPIMSDSARMFMAKRIDDIVALTMIIIAIAGALSILSYSSYDSAFNVAGGGAIENWMGAGGAAFADISLTTIGYGIWGAFIVIGITGLRLIKRKIFVIPVAVRIVALIMGVFALSGAFARLIAPESWGDNLYLGGVIGAYILNTLSEYVPFIHSLIALMCLIIGLVLCAIAIGYPLHSWQKGWARLMNFMAFIIHKFRTMMGWVSHYDAMAQSEPPQRLQKRDPIMSLPSSHNDTDVDFTDRVIEPIVVKPVKIAQAETQKSLSLKSRDDGDWEYPSIELMQKAPAQTVDNVDPQALTRNAQMLQQVLEDFSVQGDIVKIHPGPVVTLYELEPAPGTKSSRVIGLADDIARSMSAVSVRAAVVPGRNVIGIEIPNKKRAIVYMRDVLEHSEYQNSTCKLPLILGKDIGGQPIIADLARMPHLLVAGTTGSGKSVGVNTMLLSLLYKLPPEKCRFIMIDPKMLELSVYNDIPHLLAPVVTEPGKAVVALKWAVNEMEERYRAMSKVGVRNIDGYNARILEAKKNGEVLSRRVQTGFDPDTGKPTYEEQPIELVELPYIVIIVDEFADLMLVAGKDVESAIQRLAQMARAAGLHIIMATQRPSVDVITGVIKANFPTRISFQVTSKIDSRTILGEGGAEQLLGMGDMLYMAGGGQIKRVHGPFVADEEVQAVVEHVKSQGETDYMDTSVGAIGGNGIFDMFGGEDGVGSGAELDELYDEAVALVAREGKASTSFIQRYLKIGYNRAASIIEEMERQGVVSPATATGKREVLIGER